MNYGCHKLNPVMKTVSTRSALETINLIQEGCSVQ